MNDRLEQNKRTVTAFYDLIAIWRFRGSEIVELRAFVIKFDVNHETRSAA